jgi:hypothetical protein
VAVLLNKKVGGAAAAAIAIATAVAGGSWALNLDFSQDNDTTIIDDHSTNIGGDTIIGDVRDEAILAVVCLADPIPEEYVKACQER